MYKFSVKSIEVVIGRGTDEKIYIFKSRLSNNFIVVYEKESRYTTVDNMSGEQVKQLIAETRDKH